MEHDKLSSPFEIREEILNLLGDESDDDMSDSDRKVRCKVKNIVLQLLCLRPAAKLGAGARLLRDVRPDEAKKLSKRIANDNQQFFGAAGMMAARTREGKHCGGDKPSDRKRKAADIEDAVKHILL